MARTYALYTVPFAYLSHGCIKTHPYFDGVDVFINKFNLLLTVYVLTIMRLFYVPSEFPKNRLRLIGK